MSNGGVTFDIELDLFSIDESLKLIFEALDQADKEITEYYIKGILSLEEYKEVLEETSKGFAEIIMQLKYKEKVNEGKRIQ